MAPSTRLTNKRPPTTPPPDSPSQCTPDQSPPKRARLGDESTVDTQAQPDSPQTFPDPTPSAASDQKSVVSSDSDQTVSDSRTAEPPKTTTDTAVPQPDATHTLPQPPPPPPSPSKALGGLTLGTGVDDTDKVTTLTRTYFREPFISRLNRLLAYASPENQMYSPRSLPTSGDMAWGKGENSQFLFLDGKPVTVWLIGESRFWKFREFNAEKRTYIPVGRVVMGVALFHEVDRQAIAAVTAKYSSPPKEPAQPAPDVVWPGCFMGEYGAPVESIDTFAECYDATEKWSGAADMKEDLIPPWKIAKNDVVLVEAGLERRYATYKAFVDGKEIKKTDYSKWQLGFKLLHVGLLASAPKTSPFQKNVQPFSA